MRAVPALDFLDDELEALDRAGRRRVVRTIEGRRGCEVVVDGRTLVGFASNDYLGLAQDPRLAAAASAAEAEHGVGAGASRLISGHSTLTDRLEAALAAHVGAPSARLFNSGYAANTGLLPVLAGEGDLIFSDSLNHASLIDGCRLSRARVVVYRHADVDHLAQLLGTEHGRRRIVVTESIFSMDGDRAPLERIVALARAHDAVTVVDDAHAYGILGQHGAGLGWAAGADVVVGTLGKAIGAAGAFVAGPTKLAELLWNRARPLVFSTGLTVGTQAAALAGLEVVRGPDGDLRRRRLRVLVDRLCEALRIPGAPGAIVPFLLGTEDRAVSVARHLESRGFWVPAIRPPTVPLGTSRLRIALSSDQTDAALDRLIVEIAGNPANRIQPVFHVEHNL